MTDQRRPEPAPRPRRTAPFGRRRQRDDEASRREPPGLRLRRRQGEPVPPAPPRARPDGRRSAEPTGEVPIPAAWLQPYDIDVRPVANRAKLGAAETDLPRRRRRSTTPERFRQELAAAGLSGIGGRVAHTGLGTSVLDREGRTVISPLGWSIHDELAAGTDADESSSWSPRRPGRVDTDSREPSTARPHLVTLNALCVLLVIAHHSGVGLLPGGFVGIDVAFVVLGFLLTHAVLRDIIDGSGTSGDRLVRFYARHSRRILPAVIVNLVGSLFVYRTLATGAKASGARRSIQAAALFVSNLWQHGTASPHGVAVTDGPTPTYWVVSIIGQMVLLLPWFLLFTLVWFGRWRMPAVLATVAGVSVTAALFLSWTSADTAFTSTGTRLYQFVVGALVAIGADKLRPTAESAELRARLPLIVVGAIVAIASPIVAVPPVYRGLFAVGLTATLLLVTEVDRAVPVSRVLTLPILRYLGQIAFGTFLWHWLVLAVIAGNWTMGPFATAAATLVVAGGLAALSHELIEAPIRRSAVDERLDGVMIGVGLVSCLVVALVLAPLAFR